VVADLLRYPKILAATGGAFSPGGALKKSQKWCPQPQNSSRKNTKFERVAASACLRLWLRRFGFAHDFSRLLLLGVRSPDHFFAILDRTNAIS
jgi:hypothetical protein